MKALKDDEKLAGRIRDGDPAAFDDFFDRHGGPLLGYLGGMVGEKCAAEDILQETVLRVFRRIDRYRERGAFRAWVYRIATNLALTELRRRRFHAGSLDDRTERIPDLRAPDPLGRLEELERREILREGIALLPDEQRAVILLRVRRGFGIREIARTLGVPEGTVKSRIHHGVRRLREHFERVESPRNEETSNEEL